MMAKNHRVGIVALVEPLNVRVVGMGIHEFLPSFSMTCGTVRCLGGTTK